MKKYLLNLYHLIVRKGHGTIKWKKQFTYFGKGASIAYPATISLDKGNIFVGDGSVIKKNSRIQNFDYAGSWEKLEINIGCNCYIGSHFTILNASKVIIGDNVLIASYVMISSENHTADPESPLWYKDLPLQTSPTKIGDGCWLGEKVVVLPGVSIGKKCVIGAGSVVTKSIPDYCIAVGNPAKVIKKYNFYNHKWERV